METLSGVFGFESALSSFVVGAQAILDANYPEGYPENCKETLTIDTGRAPSRTSEGVPH